MDNENSALTSSTNYPLPGHDPNETLPRNKEISEEVVFLQNLDLNFWKHGTPALYCIGCVGNLVTILVLRR